jgi:hemoglobin-like flavoprotein
MNARNLRLVQESFDRLWLHDGELAVIFAKELSRVAAGEISAERQHDLLEIISAAVPSLGADEHSLATIASSHCHGTIQPHDFEYAGNALLRTLRALLGQEFSYDLWQAWIEALHTLSHVLTLAPHPAVASAAHQPA